SVRCCCSSRWWSERASPSLRAQRSNPVCRRRGILDCFAALAKTMDAGSHQTLTQCMAPLAGIPATQLVIPYPLTTLPRSPPSIPGTPRMSALFSPIKLRGLTLKNRLVVSPMCQYSADDGVANDWHFTHINNLALSGAAMFCIEATHVEATGRITPGCLGLYNDATEAALKPSLASVRKHTTTPVSTQLAAAGRKGSTHGPCDAGQR